MNTPFDAFLYEKWEREPFLKVHPLAPLPLLCFLVFNPTGEILFVFLAAFLHEMGHLLALLLVKGEIGQVRIEPFGIKILLKGKLLHYKASLFVTGAGVLVNALCSLLLLLPSLPSFLWIFAVSSFGLAIFNLLPIEKLDGFLLLKEGLSLFLSEQTATKIAKKCSFISSILLFILSLSLLFSTYFNPMLFLMSLYLLWSLTN